MPHTISTPEHSERSTFPAIKTGFFGKCPACGDGKIFGAFLKVNDSCQACGEELHHQRADDFPPYLVIFIVGHVVLTLVLLVEVQYQLSTFAHLSIWLPLTLVMALALLQPVKGAVIGLQWAQRMHGFGGDET